MNSTTNWELLSGSYLTTSTMSVTTNVVEFFSTSEAETSIYNVTDILQVSLCGIPMNYSMPSSDYSFLLPSFFYVCILLCLGIFGNALVLYVYLFKWPKSTSRVFILSLAMYDMLNCTTSMPHELALLLHFDQFDFPVLCKISRFITGMINNTTTFILIVIAVDRYKRICKPHRRHITPCLGKKLVLAATLFGIGTNWPMLLLYGTINLPGGGQTCLIESRWLTTKFPLLFVMFLLIGHLVTDIILIVLYSLVGKAIFNRRHFLKSTRAKETKPEVSQSSYTVDEMDSEDVEQKRTRLASFVFWNRVSDEFRKRSNTTDSKVKAKGKPKVTNKKSISLLRRALSKVSSVDQGNRVNARVGKTTLMLFLVTVVFILSFIPHVAMVILRYTNPSFVMCLSYSGKSIYQMTLRSYLLNSVLNPLVYCFVSNQFRSKCSKALSQIFCCAESNHTHSRSVTGGHSEN